MRCSNCGKEILDNAEFCSNCGKKLISTESVGGQVSEIYNPNENNNKINIGLVILSFFIPIVGLIVFLTKKDKEPKTAKVSGICALVSFILSSILVIISVFLYVQFSLNSSKDLIKEDGKKDDKVIDKIVQDKNDDVKDDQESINSSGKWSNYEVVINGKTIKLPCTYDELTNISGFKIKSSQENSSLSSNSYVLVNMYKNDKLALYTEILNDTSSDIKYTDGKVTRISQTKYQVSTGADQIIFPGNIKAGDKITKEEILSKYGEPTKIRNYSNDGYESDTYIYNADKNWTTTNYFEIKVVNSIIDEITLDNRNYK